MYTLQINKKRMWYCLQGAEETVYKTDSSGNIIYQEIDGANVPIPKGKVRNYYNPTEFKASFSMQGNHEAEAVEYGIDIAQYHAKIVSEIGKLPFTETTLIWLSEPKADLSGKVEKETADYKVVKVSSSLNFDTYLLQKVAKNG